MGRKKGCLKKRLYCYLEALDSATVLAIATKANYECYALSINYHQRHNYELTAAKQIAKYFSVKDFKDVDIDLSWLNKFGIN